MALRRGVIVIRIRPCPFIACAALISRFRMVARTISASASTDACSPSMLISTCSAIGSRRTIVTASCGERAKFDVAESQRAGTGKHHQVVDQLAQRIDPADDVAHHRQFGVAAGPARHQDLHRPFDAGERVADFVGHDGRHLPQSRQCGLLCQLLLSRLACRDVRPDGDVLVGFAALVDEGNDGRVDPVVVAVFGAIPNFAVPDLAVGDGPPQLAHELLRVILRS